MQYKYFFPCIIRFIQGSFRVRWQDIGMHGYDAFGALAIERAVCMILSAVAMA